MPEKRKLPDEVIPPEEKIARLVGLIAIKGLENQDAQVALLRTAGFQNPVVAEMLGISENHVAVAWYKSRRRKRPRKGTTKKR